MQNSNIFSEKQSLLIEYLVSKYKKGEFKLPSIHEISKELSISVSSLREQLEVVKSMGLIEAQPRTGIHLLPYRFMPAIEKSVLFATLLDRRYFYQFSELRNSIERSYFKEAVEKLTQEDIKELRFCVKIAEQKLSSDPIQIPYLEQAICIF